MPLTLRVRGLFFDSPKVMRAMDAAKRKALSKAGAYIRSDARQSMRRRIGPAPPGQPPHAHGGQIKRYLFFSYDMGSDSVVVGPEKLPGAGDAPPTQEFGGTVTLRRPRVIEVGDVGRNVRGQFTARKKRYLKKGTRVTVKPRPFMGPAMVKNLPNIPKGFANSIKGG